MVKLYFKLFYLCLLISCNSDSTKNAKEANLKKTDIELLVSEMANYEVYEFSDGYCNQWARYKTLSKNATEDYLIKLCNHSNPVVRCYAFKALTDRSSKHTFDILLKHIADTAEFTVEGGCMSAQEFVTDFYLDNSGYYGNETTKFCLSSEQMKYIDSTLLYDNSIKERHFNGWIKYRSRQNMLVNLDPKPLYYARLKEILVAGVPEAIIPLAKYNKVDDTVTIINLLKNDNDRSREYAFSAIINFPNPIFYPILEKLLIEGLENNRVGLNETEILYRALVQYKTNQTRILLETTLKKSKEDELQFRLGYLRRALKAYPDPIFAGLYTYTMQYCRF